MNVVRFLDKVFMWSRIEGYHVWGYQDASIRKAFATNKNVQLGRPGATYKQKGEAPSETI